MKRLTARHSAVLIAILIVFHLAGGLLFSPAATRLVVRLLSERTRAHVTLETARVWPLTLSVSLKGLEIFDPVDTRERLVSVERVSARLSPLGLLLGRIVLAEAALDEVDLTFEETSDGTFTIGKLGAAEPASGALPPDGKQKDLFGTAYERLTNGALQPRAQSEAHGGSRESGGTCRQPGSHGVEVVSLSARRVNAHLKTSDGDSLHISPVQVRLRRACCAPAHGLSFDGASLSGSLVKEGMPAGTVMIRFLRSRIRGEERMDIAVSAQDVDLAAVRFMYRDSLPVLVERGVLDVESTVSITAGELSSRHALSLSKHLFAPSSTAGRGDALLAPVVCAALNERDPFAIEFPLNGSLENPDFGPLVQALLRQVKPSVQSVNDALDTLFGA